MTFIRNITFRFYFILVLIFVLSIEVPEALCRQLFLLYLGICLFGSLCLLYMVHALASLWVTKKWTMHNTEMEKQINLINTFKMTMIFPFFHFWVIFEREKDFFGWPWPCTKQIALELFRDAKTLQNEVLYDSLWLLFLKFWNSHFLMAANLAVILNLLTRNFFRLRTKLYLVCQNLALCQIWNLDT